MRIHKRMLKASNCLTYFTTHQWTFKSNNVLALLDQMSENDRQEFHFDLKVGGMFRWLAGWKKGKRKTVYGAITHGPLGEVPLPS